VSATPAASAPLLELDRVSKVFVSGLLRRTRVPAVREVSLALARGETLGIVGESGSGKSTLARLALRLAPPTSGEVRFDGAPITRLSDGALRPLRRRMQIVFQDPYASLNPHHTVRAIVAEPLLVHGVARRERDAEPRVRELLARVGLGVDALDRYPSAFSGGQRQRIAIARAIALEPELLVLDEPTSALDVSIQAQVVTLLEELQRERGLAYLFISHDLALVEHMASRVAVMYLGRVVESGPRASVVLAPKHPYTAALLAAVPTTDPQRRRLRVLVPGEIPSPASAPAGCAFHPRCERARPGVCDADEPPLTGDAHAARCFFPLDPPATP
jgi:oligopeptide/dipeptide ABC transporter ATP-binding protein